MSLSERLLTVRETAAYLKLNPLTVYGYIKGGKLPAVKFGRYYRITEADLQLFTAANKTEASYV